MAAVRVSVYISGVRRKEPLAVCGHLALHVRQVVSSLELGSLLLHQQKTPS